MCRSGQRYRVQEDVKSIRRSNEGLSGYGCLQVYTRRGKRVVPTMMMGSDECLKLLLVMKNGSLYVWDLFNKTYLISSGSEDPDLVRSSAREYKWRLNWRCYSKRIK
ncbi:hypothetical protein MKW98_018726 [Papaver atlanticum]|uniref:Uncharacterized protein n=1 Tax=Papaver atlanticum TaxID=357466 RepID=A0AAD4T5P7_9MAGN|nr:hypothetical protein MKW98_018726 [Papaver atlanticum]